MNDNEVLLKEYESLRSEVIERIKTAFAHLGYFGAVIAFAFPASDKLQANPNVALWLAIFGSAILAYISIINWLWVDRIADHLRLLEKQILGDNHKPLLTWEGKVALLSRWVLLPPRPSSALNPKNEA